MTGGLANHLVFVGPGRAPPHGRIGNGIHMNHNSPILRLTRPEPRRPLSMRAYAETATVGAVMTAPLCVYEGVLLDDARRMLADNRFSAATVVDPAGIAIGFVTPRDLMRDGPPGSGGAGAGAAPRVSRVERAVRDVMMPFAFTVRLGTSIATAARLMVCEGISHLPVVDRVCRVVGMVSALDLVRLAVSSAASGEGP